MNKLLLTAAAALLMTAGVAVAQTTTSETTTTITPIEVMPTNGSGKFPTPNDALQAEDPMSVTRTVRTIGADGSETDTTRTTYRNSDGVADDSVTRTTTYPVAPPAVTTTTTKTWSTTTE